MGKGKEDRGEKKEKERRGPEQITMQDAGTVAKKRKGCDVTKDRV